MAFHKGTVFQAFTHTYFFYEFVQNHSTGCPHLSFQQLEQPVYYYVFKLLIKFEGDFIEKAMDLRLTV